MCVCVCVCDAPLLALSGGSTYGLWCPVYGLLILLSSGEIRDGGDDTDPLPPARAVRQTVRVNTARLPMVTSGDTLPFPTAH